MALDRDTSAALSINALGRSEIPALAIGRDGVPSVLFSPGGDLNRPGASGTFVSTITFCNGVKSYVLSVDDAGLLVELGGQVPLSANNFRWPTQTRFMGRMPSELVLCAGPDRFVRFGHGGMTLYSNSNAFDYVLNAGATAFVATPYPLSTMAAIMQYPTFARKDGAVSVGPTRPIPTGQSTHLLRVASYVRGIEVRASGGGEAHIRMQSADGTWRVIRPNAATGVLEVA